jgi:hypothetical protein
VPPDDLDATIKLPRNRGPAAKVDMKPARAGGGRAKWIAAGAAAVVVLAIGGGALLWRGKPSPPALPTPPGLAPAGLAPAPPPAASLLPLRSETEILAGRAETLLAMRFDANSRIVVLDFPTLAAQGRAFNRMAAFLEKMGLPRDRVLNDGEMVEAIRADKATVETYYYGHDYRAVDIARFYQAVDRQGMALGPDELALRALLEREGLLKPGANAAVISIPREGSDPFVDASGRASLLRHELSHGEYFTNPDYAAFSRRFWNEEMSEADRGAFRAFLRRQDYDPANEDLIINEMQAHLMHTTDIRYFNARDCGIPPERVEALRTAFLARMPAGWLHDVAAALRR